MSNTFDINVQIKFPPDGINQTIFDHQMEYSVQITFRQQWNDNRWEERSLHQSITNCLLIPVSSVISERSSLDLVRDLSKSTYNHLSLFQSAQDFFSHSLISVSTQKWLLSSSPSSQIHLSAGQPWLPVSNGEKCWIIVTNPPSSPLIDSEQAPYIDINQNFPAVIIAFYLQPPSHQPTSPTPTHQYTHYDGNYYSLFSCRLQFNNIGGKIKYTYLSRWIMMNFARHHN